VRVEDGVDAVSEGGEGGECPDFLRGGGFGVEGVLLDAGGDGEEAVDELDE